MTSDNVTPLEQARRPLADSAEVAAYLGTTPAGLAQLRYRGDGPQYVRVGSRKVMYRWADVDEWVQAHLSSQ